MSEPSKLSPGAAELVCRFKEKYILMTEDEKQKAGYEMFISGHYALSAAESAFKALGEEYRWPNMNWSLDGVTFIFNSGIPSIIGMIISPPNEFTLISGRCFAAALAITESLAIIAAILLEMSVPASHQSYGLLLAPPLFALLISMMASVIIADVIVRTRFKR